MRCPVVDFTLYLGLALTMWADELLSWPLVLIGGNLERDRH